MLVILLPFLVGLLEKVAFLGLNFQSKFQELKIIITYFTFTLISIFYLYTFQNGIDFSIFKEPLVYCAVIAELIAFTVARFNYEHQNNYTVISFAQLSSLFLIFPITLIFDYIFQINSVSLEKFQTNIIYFSLYFFVTLSYIIYVYKNGKIKYISTLIIHAISLPIAMYFFTRISISGHALTVYPMLFFIISLSNIPKIIKNKNKYRKKYIFSKKYIKSIFIFMFSIVSSFLLSIYVALNMSAEFFTIFKRIGQLTSSMIIDNFLKGIKFKKVEIIFSLLIFIITFFLYTNN